jgi:hypothetical protein
MSKVRLVAQASGLTLPGDVSSSALLNQLNDDEAGALQIQMTGGSADKLNYQARLSPDFGWVTLTDTTQNGGPASLSSTTNLILTDLSVLPQMRVQVVNPVSASFKIYFME